MLMRLSKYCFVSSIIFSIIFFALASEVFATPVGDASPTVSAQQLQADFAVLKRAYEELHPGLYRYNSKARMEANFKALETELNRDLTLQQAYVAFSIFLAKIKCGHSYPNFYNQPKDIADALFKGQDKLPFYFRWINRRMIITENFSEDARLKAGTEVLSINGVPVRIVLERLMTIARADGSNDAKRISYLEVLGENNYEAFDVYFPMFFPPASNRFELRVKEFATGSLKTLNVKALTYEQRLAPIKAKVEARRDGGNEPVWEFKFLDERTAYLRMPTWALFNSKWDWEKFLESSFDQLAEKKTANLIIDLRGNEGGLSVGDVILSRLITRDLRLEQFKRLVRYRKASEDLLPYLDTWDKSFKDWGESAVDFKDGFYTLKRYNDKDGNIIKASSRPYKGRAFVLVDASNSSATFEFAQTAQQNKLATLVGQSTGGNQLGINGGAFFFLRLPNSKIEIDLPLIGFFPSGARPDAGLLPDVPVESNVKDAGRGVDTELNALKNYLRSFR
jgi:hypothetical protein